MRRVILGLVTTAIALVLLLSFKTHTQSAVPGSTPASVVGSPTPGRGASSGAAVPSASSVTSREQPGAVPRVSGRRGADGHRPGVPDDLRPGTGQGHRHQRPDHRRHRCPVPAGHPARLPDQLLRDPAAEPAGGGGGQREDRRGIWRHVHLGRLHRLAAERPRPAERRVTADTFQCHRVHSACVGDRRAARTAGSSPAAAPMSRAAPRPPAHPSGGMTMAHPLAWA